MRSVRQSVAIAGCLFVCLAGSAAAQSVERALYASVVDKSGAPVADLTARDFLVREDRVSREVLRVSQATDSMQIALLVDNSQASEPFISDLRRALTEWLGVIGDQQVALIAFGQRPTILVDYTRDRKRLAEGVDRLFAQTGSGAYLMDSLMEAVQGLQRQEGTRRVVVVVTTQGPEFSSHYSKAVLDRLRQSGVIMEVFVLTDRAGRGIDASGMRQGVSVTDTTFDQNARERELTLSLGPEMTGGRREDLASSMALPNRLRDLAAELNHQYRVVYSGTGDLIPAESVQVSMRRPELRVRATRVPPK